MDELLDFLAAMANEDVHDEMEKEREEEDEKYLGDTKEGTSEWE